MECAVSGGNKLKRGRNLVSNFRKINFPIIQSNKIIDIILMFIAKITSSLKLELGNKVTCVRFGVYFCSYKKVQHF